MKKNLMLLVLGFVFSVSAFASNVVKNENTVCSPKNCIGKFNKPEQNKFIEFCMEVYAFVATCPDGSQFIGFVDVYIYDCATGFTLGAACVYESSYEANCNDY